MKADLKEVMTPSVVVLLSAVSFSGALFSVIEYFVKHTWYQLYEAIAWLVVWLVSLLIFQQRHRHRKDIAPKTKT
jgi:membrane protein YdbS with pleckstrin-like domain